MIYAHHLLLLSLGQCNHSRRRQCFRHVARMGYKNAQIIFAGKYSSTAIEKTKKRWKDTIAMGPR